ncbi:hypothetical protein [Streptomyces uncialis]|uniref:hypothetical protein n=1 Tax=Streptomyces uncialis TaxID=1048205 RepID=UPI00093F143D|nr:hypothetical protein [Streptomyces uncialis]
MPGRPRRIVPLLGPDAPPAERLENCMLYPGCYQPLYGSAASHMLIVERVETHPFGLRSQ